MTMTEAKPESNTKPDKLEIIRDEKGRFLPGATPNPYGSGGRPVGSVSLVTKLKEHLAEHPEDVATIVKQFVELGKRPNLSQLSAIDKLMDRIDGKVAETHRIEGDIPIRLVFVPATQVLNEAHQDANLGTPKDTPLLSDGQGGITDGT